jgi:hypothetical protein
MIRSFNIRLLPLLLLMLAIGVGACTKDDDETNGPAELLSFGPTGAMHGDTLWFIGNNLQKVTAIQFTGALVEQKDFKKQDAEQILVIVPDAAVRGTVTLKTPDGDIVSKTQLNFEVAPTVTALTAEARPGANVTLTGSFLNWVTAITFADGKEVTTFVSQAFDKIEVTVPEDAQTGTLELAYSGTEPMSTETTQELKVTLPVVTGLAPNPVKHTANLTITGTNLDLARKITLAGVAEGITTFVSQSATEIVVAVPASATGGKVILTAPSGVTTESTPEFAVQLPAITSITPLQTDPGETLTINGSNLDLVTSISFSGVSTPVTAFESKTASRITVKVPQGALKGKVVLSVLNSTLKVTSAEELTMKTLLVVPFKSTVYTDDFNANWEKWGGWGTASQEVGSTEQAYTGAKSIKVVYAADNQYGAVQLHPRTTFALPGGHTHMRLSIYGGANTTASSQVAIYLKDATDPANEQKKVLRLRPGQWTTYEIPLSDFTNNPAKINEFVIQNYGTASLTIYIDEVGFF